MAHFGVYFTNGKNETIELPVAPEEFGLGGELDSETVKVSQLGEVNLRGKRKLYEIDIDFLIPFTVSTARYTTATKPLPNGEDYIMWIRDWHTSDKPAGRLVVTGSSNTFSIPVTLEKFKYTLENADDQVYKATVSLKEWRSYAAQRIAPPTPQNTVAKKAPDKPTPAKAVTVGCTVVVNGQLHRGSDGSGPGATERNETRKVNFIAAGNKCPYHVTTTDGGWRGWVEAKAVVVK
jgi:hypothetical protein